MIKRTTWVVLAVFLLTLAVVLLLQRTGKLEYTADSTPSPTAASVFGLDTGSIKQVKVESSGIDSATFTHNSDGTWTTTAPTGFNPDAAIVKEALDSISTWTVQNELQVAPPLDAVGLTNPDKLIVIQTDSGQEHTIQVGGLNPAQTGYYLLLDGGAPFLISRYSVDPVLGLLDQLHVTPAPPAPGLITPVVTASP
jgi:hypothetical protein